MNAPVTRRALLGATAAVGACALPAVAEGGFPAALPADPDAELFRLLDRFDAARAAWDATEAPLEEAMRRAVAARPPTPAALLSREGDFLGTSLGTGLSDRIGVDDEDRRYGARAAAWLRKKPAAEWYGPGWMPTVIARWEERRREVVEAFDAWEAACRAVDDEVGFTAASEAEDAAGLAWNAADDAVKHYQPRTLAGLAHKASWVAERLAIGNCDDDLGEAFARQVAAFGGVAA